LSDPTETEMATPNTEPIISRFLLALPAEELGEIVSVTRNEFGITVVWVWMPESICTVWEGEPVYHAQLGKYAFRDDEDKEPG
jgi:hypothetical protein